jgi:uncharacterized protein (TIGR00725 family)
MTKKYVAVSGPGAEATEGDIARAYEVGAQLAAADLVVLTGGLGGVMAGAAAGVKSVNGTCIGLLPGADRSQANVDLTLSIPTGLGELRNGLLIRAADAVLVIGGSWGTLSELALAERSQVPTVTLGGWRVDEKARSNAKVANTAAEATALILDALG